MSNILYLDDYRNGLHLYTPEMNQRKPATKMEASLSYYGTHYFVDTPLELKGRGITEIPANWAPGTDKAAEGWRTYQVTKRAFEKLKAEHSISMACYLD